MGKSLINPTFHELKKEKKQFETTEKYIEYRRKWSENPKKHIVENFPIHLDLESTSACNLKCKMCFQSYDPPARGFMDFELFKKIIDEGVSKGLYSIKLQYRGEPLLHPKIVEMIKYAKDKGVVEVMFNTNATLLTEKMARGLIEAGLNKIICSVDGFEKEPYEKIRIGANFDKVVENLKRLQRLKKELSSETPVIRVQMIDMPETHHKIQEYIDFWDKIADDIAIEDLNDYHKDKDTNALISKDFECSQLWQRLFVLWDGKITLCCGDIYSDLVVGDANKDSLSDIWKSDLLNKFRKLHIEGMSHKMNICAKCGFRNTVIKLHGLKEC